MTLLHLLSNETMQNLYPLIALKPENVIQIASKGNFINKAKDIQSAYKMYCLANNVANQPTFLEVIQTPTGTPSIDETKQVVDTIFLKYPNLEINFTGGTKQMSFGAYMVALKHKLPSYYCDTQKGFIQGGNTSISELTIPIDEIFKKLNCEIILAANGLQPNTWKAIKKLKPKEQRIGELAFSLLRQFNSGLDKYMKNVRKVVTTKSTTMPSPPNELIKSYLEVLTESGIVNRGQDQYFLVLKKYCTKDGRQQTENIDDAFKRIDGDPFEFYVHHCMLQSQRFFDVRRSVNTFGVQTETDLICMDIKTKGLALISCKTTSSGASITHLESLVERKKRFGGLFGDPILCVGIDKSKKNELQNKCSELKIQLLVGEEIEEFFS